MRSHVNLNLAMEILMVTTSTDVNGSNLSANWFS